MTRMSRLTSKSRWESYPDEWGSSWHTSSGSEEEIAWEYTTVVNDESLNKLLQKDLCPADPRGDDDCCDNEGENRVYWLWCDD